MSKVTIAGFESRTNQADGSTFRVMILTGPVRFVTSAEGTMYVDTPKRLVFLT